MLSLFVLKLAKQSQSASCDPIHTALFGVQVLTLLVDKVSNYACTATFAAKQQKKKQQKLGVEIFCKN